MILLVIFLVFVCLIAAGALCLRFGGTREVRDGGDVMVGFGTVLAVLMAVVMVIVFSASYSRHLDDMESLNIIQDEIELYEQRSDNIKEQVARVLVDRYAEHEQDIFDKLSGDGISVYLVKYPELHAHETFKSYSEMLIGLKDDIYRFRHRELELRKSMRVRERAVHTLRFLLPSGDSN